jgi:hypothetical protein
MPEFYVYSNSIVKKVRVHRASCGACKGGKGMHEGRIGGHKKTDRWEGAATYQEARALAEKRRRPMGGTDSRIDCGLCHPARER